MSAAQLPPLSLYIHIPWCLQKCPYCDFNSHASHGESVPEEEYVDCLLRDLQSEMALVQGRP
ncbi:MAG TPA: YggW family oxidoreductase, partial [Oceanospirillaceae bacterium]|nr:YggW family oxidoreductase [Oceanospirillaceae bacterium]